MKTKHWAMHQISIVVIMVFFLFGCIGFTTTPISTPTPTVTFSPEQTDKSLFTQIPCAAPCWYGLEVGKSTEKDATTILPTLSFIDQKSIQIFRRPSMPDYYVKLYGPGIEIVANCINSDRKCLELTTANDILQKIIIGLNYEIRPDEAIGYLGNPDYIGYDDFSAERVMCEVYLVWRSSRLVLATRFEDPVGAEKYCYVIRGEGKVPASLRILEARLLSDVELNAKLATATGKFFEFSGTIPDK